MIRFHAVMIDETGCEFGVTFEAASRSLAYETLQEDYPESRIDALKTCAEWDRAEQDRHDRLQAMYDDDTIDLY